MPFTPSYLKSNHFRSKGRKGNTIKCGFPKLSIIEDTNRFLQNCSKSVTRPDDLLSFNDGLILPETPILYPTTNKSTNVKRGQSCEKRHKSNFSIVDKKGACRSVDLVFTGNTEEVAKFLREDNTEFRCELNREGRRQLKVRILICENDITKESNDFSAKIYGYLLKKRVEHGEIFQLNCITIFIKKNVL